MYMCVCVGGGTGEEREQLSASLCSVPDQVWAPQMEMLA